MIRENGPRTVFASLLLCAVGAAAGCKFESDAIPATQLVVDIDAQPRVKSRLQTLHIFAAGASHRDTLADRDQAFDQIVTPGADPESPSWPVRVVLEPKSGDARRALELSATALNADNEQIAQARVMTGYVSHQVKYVKLVLEDDCIDVTCDDLQTCKVGGCTDAWIDPQDLPLLPGRVRDAGVEDAGEAGVVDSGVDAGEDAGRDSGTDSGIIVGPMDDPCMRVDHGGCDPLVVCQTIDNVPTCGQCPNGYVDVNGNGSRCEDIDECKQPDMGGCDTKNGTCTNTPGGYDCACKAGFNGDGHTCTQNVPCDSDPNVCDTLATCQAIDGHKVCQCKMGYEGDGARCTNINECTRNLHNCPVHSTCADSEGSFTCTCNKGYRKPANGDNLCNDIDECTENTDNCDDNPNACRNTDGAFMCVCPAGYTGLGVGNTCQDVDECMSNTDNCNTNPDACINDVGSFHCMCPAGYTGSGLRGTCRDRDECAMNLDTCAAAPAACVNDIGGTPGYHCTCPATGYTGMGTAADPCVDINECTPNNGLGPCNTNATCANTPAGSFTCTCKDGFMPSAQNPGQGTNGCTDINECSANAGLGPCNANGSCANTPAGSFTCSCDAGYTKVGDGTGAGGCTDTNECAANGGLGPCNANGSCANMPAGSFTCSCNAGFTKVGDGTGAGGCTDNDECAANGGLGPCNANGSCSNMPAGSFTCSCGTGFTKVGDGTGSGGCVDTNECMPTNPCMNGGMCTDAVAPATGHTCACTCGFTGANCMTAQTPVNNGLTSGAPSFPLTAGTAYFTQISIAAGGRLSGLGVGNVGGSAMFRMALYKDAASSPGERVAVVGPTTGTGTVTFPIAACTAVTAGTYWVAILADAALTIGQDTNSVTGYDQASSTLADPAGPVMAASRNNLAVYAITVP